MPVPNIARRDGMVPVETQVRRIIGEAMQGKNRNEIALRMGELLDRPVPVHTLADFTRNPTKRRHIRFPVAWVPAFCEATGNESLQLFVLSAENQEMLRLGKWLTQSGWVLEKVNIKFGRQLRRELRTKRTAL